MAQGKKYKLGELEFETEQEYREAAADLKRIKGLVDKYNVEDPEQAKKILASIQAHPDTFRSTYGRKFVAKLQKAAGLAPTAAASAGAGDDKAAAKRAKKEEKEKRKREKQLAKSESRKADSGQKEKFQIFTPRNFAIGVVIVACVVVFSIFAPRMFSLNKGGDSNGDIRRNMVIAYAKNQADLKANLYTYYYNVVGQTEEEAEKDATEGLGNYVMDLSDRTVSTMTDTEISDIYNRLVEGGDIQNNSFVEPSEITVLKDKLLAAGLSGNSGNGLEGETAVEAAINSMMDYQHRIYASLCHNYSLLGNAIENPQAYADEDMSKMFGEVIFDYNMTIDDKQSYFDSFNKRGLIKDNQVVRFSADPTVYNLPELTPTIEVSFMGEEAKAYECSMISYAPASSVFYEIHAGKKSGYICMRNNGGNTDYIQLGDTTVTAQGDFIMAVGSEVQTGRWFYNQQNIGIFINGDTSSLISYVHDLTY
ncbi:MAG: hypothetical protein K2P45_09160 [Eubacterium sp.]|nr:hypothetical protein [Eubacterium sp.]